MSRLTELSAPADPLQRRKPGLTIAANPAHAHQRQPLPANTAAHAPRFTVGRDRGGRWIVQDRDGRVGGLFANEAAALHFAAEECNHNGAEICRANADIVLEFAPFAGIANNIH